MAHALGFRTVVHYHEYGYAAFFASLGPVAKGLVGGALRGARAHIVLGESEAEKLPPLLGVPANTFVVLPNGAPSHLLSAPRSDPASGEVTILFVGALSARKGVEDLLKAAAQLPATLPSWRLVFCGAGDIAKLKALAAGVGISERVTFKGQVANPDVRAVMARSRIFILPSYAEGLSIALLEAMALGCAVVATDVGEQGQVLRHDHNALVVTPGDVDAIASALARLIEDADLSVRLGVHAREDIAAGFTIERNLTECARALAR
jgi:glycosyltransferase involved in cell wall biosynthesis